MPRDILISACNGHCLFLITARRQLNTGAQFTVYLDHQCDLITYASRLVDFRPVCTDHTTCLTQHFPQGFTDVRGDWSHQAYHGPPGLIQHRTALRAAILEPTQVVAQLHNGGNCGVKCLAASYIVTDLGNGVMHVTANGLLLRIQLLAIQVFNRAGNNVFGTHEPQATQKAECAFHT